MPWKPTNRSAVVALAGVLVVGLLLRLGVGWWWQSRLPPGTQFYFGDSQTYWDLGHSIARGGPYDAGSAESRVFRTPGYPLLLAGLIRMQGEHASVMWARALSAVLGTLAIGGVYWAAQQLFDRRAALAAAAMVAVYPEAVVAGAWVLSEAPFTAALMLQLALCAAAWRKDQSQSRGRLAWAIAAGLAGGIATLIRPSWLFFTPLAALLAVRKPGLEKRARPWLLASGMIAGLLVAMAPWWIRNARETGHFVPTTLQVGASLYDGWNSRATGGSDMSFVPPETRAARTVYATTPAAHKDTFEYFLDRWLWKKAARWGFEHPYDALRLAGVKFLRMWSPWPNITEFRSWSAGLPIAATYLPLMLAALVGAWRFSQRGWPYVLLWLPAVYLTFFHVIFVGSLRYREPAMVALCVLAGGLFAIGCSTAAAGTVPGASAAATK
ncbi:MAG: glycosyltransferase family 39 protein [Planctomycetia bacterium]|nr:glycosyltransferase family 39 protein [Planctomycetia bacterium]